MDKPLLLVVYNYTRCDKNFKAELPEKIFLTNRIGKQARPGRRRMGCPSDSPSKRALAKKQHHVAQPDREVASLGERK